MRGALDVVLVWALLPAGSAALQPAVTVYVYNSAQVETTLLKRAETLAAGIFGKAGVRVLWVEGLIAGHMGGQRGTAQSNSPSLHLRIWRSADIQGKGINPESIGFCLSMQANEAVVLMDAIQDRAATLNAGPASALAVSMAHEMGHLLLQSAGHSLAGVMKPRWVAEDLTAAEAGTLRFAREEAISMRRAPGAMRPESK